MEFTTQITLFPISNKVKKAVDRVNMFADCSKDIPIWLATSKGKDSLVLEYVFALSNAKYEKHFSLTSVDPPELVQFAKKDKDLFIDKPRYSDGTQKTMWNLIPKKKMPPTRLVRYCCAELKESLGNGHITATGVRYEESTNRKLNQAEINIRETADIKDTLDSSFVEYRRNKSGGYLLNLDNGETRRLVEMCYRTNKTLLNPIIDFTTNEIWEIIRGESIPYCELYDCGFKRLGCIGCPINTNSKLEFERYPKYKENYIKAFQRMIDAYDKPCSWANGEECFDWWLTRKNTTNLVHEDQLSFLEEFFTD